MYTLERTMKLIRIKALQLELEHVVLEKLTDVPAGIRTLGKTGYPTTSGGHYQNL